MVGHEHVVADCFQALLEGTEHGGHRGGVEVDVLDVRRVLGDVGVVIAILVRRERVAVWPEQGAAVGAALAARLEYRVGETHGGSGLVAVASVLK